MTDRQIKNIAPATSCEVYKNFKSQEKPKIQDFFLK